MLTELNKEVRQKHLPSETDMARHPSMHRTDTLDCLTCVRGEIYLVTDTEFAKHVTSKQLIVVALKAASSATPAQSRKAIEDALRQC